MRADAADSTKLPPSDSRGRLAVQRVCLLAVLGWVLYSALGTNLFGSRQWPNTMVDFHLLCEYSRSVVDAGIYPPQYCYPPSSVALQFIVASMPFSAAAALWLALTTAAAIGIWRLLAGASNLGMLAAAPAILAAYTIVSPYFHWELRSQNCNLIYFAAVLAALVLLTRGRDTAAGVLLAFSIALKLYSVLLVPYLLCLRRWRAAAAALIASIGFWLVLPAVVCGPGGLSGIYTAWWAEFRANSSGAANLEHPILTSLANASAAMARDGHALAGAVVPAMWGAWLALAGYAAFNLRYGPGDTRQILATGSLLLLAPVALSPYLEMYHALPAAIPAWLIAVAALGPAGTPRSRLPACLLLAASLILALSPSEWATRGLRVNLHLLLLCGGSLLLTGVRAGSTQSGSAWRFDLFAKLLPMPRRSVGNR